MAEFLRRRGRILFAPVRSYVRPDTGRRVTLVGTQHIAEPGYFVEIRALIDKLEADGATVYHEGDRTSPPGDLTDAERQALQALEIQQEWQARRGAELGLVGQLDAMPIADTWQVLDLPTIEIIRLIGVDQLLAATQRQTQSLSWPDSDHHRGPNRHRLSVALMCRAQASVLLNLRRPRHMTPMRRREDVAVRCIDRTDGDLVLVWGAAHLAGLGHHLALRGFFLERVTWHRTMRIPSITASLARLLIRRPPHLIRPDAIPDPPRWPR
jgi:hypothetical protein